MRKLLSLFTALLFVGSMWGVDFTLVTSTSALADDDEIIIVNTDGDYAIGTTQNTNNRKAESVTVSENVITPSASVQTITLEASSTNWKFKVGTDQYLYAAGGNGKSPKNHLKTANSTTAGDNGVFSISIDANGVATIEGQGDATNSRMRYNPNNGTPMFSCYSSSSTVGNLVKIFKKATAPSLSIVPTSYDFGDVKDKAAASHDFTISGENLAEGTLNISVTGGYTITSGAITVDANGDLSSNTITVAKNTTTSGSNGGTLKVYGAGVAEADAATATLSMNVKETFVVNAAVLVKDKENNPVAAEDVPEGISATINGSASYDVDADGEDNIALLATTISGYDFVGWTVSNTDDLSVDEEEELSTTLTALAAGTVTANFREQSCTPLTAPANVDVDGTAYPYDAVELSWNAVTNADKYDIIIKQGEDVVESANDLTVTSYALTETLAANTTYSYEIVAKSNTPATHCDSDPASDNFVTGDYPAATLTLSENGATRPWGVGLKLNSVIDLPTAVAAGNEVAGKVLVGWSASEIAETDVKPAYTDKGANFTMNETAVTLYAVYAKETGDVEPVLSQTLQYDTWTYSGATSDKTSYRLFGEDAYVESASFDRSTLTKVTVYAGKFGNVSTPKLIVSDGTNTWAESPELTTKSHTTQVDITEGTALTGIGTIRIISNAGDGGSQSSSSGIRLSKVEIYTQIPVSYSKYTTSGAKAPTATVDPEEVEISAAALVYGLIDVTYENVNQANVTVALFNDAECTEAFDGGWLTASLDANKDIEYGADANTSYANARTAYIKLTAPATEAGPEPAVVIIPVTQAKKDAVFASFEELVASDLPRDDKTGTYVTVSFSNVKIHEISGKSVYLNIKDKVSTEQYIQIYNTTGNAPAGWTADGSLTASSNISGYWQLYSGAMELKISIDDWAGITYDSTPTAIDNAEVEGKAVKVLRNGVLYIEKNGHTYNAMGQLVK